MCVYKSRNKKEFILYILICPENCMSAGDEYSFYHDCVPLALDNSVLLQLPKFPFITKKSVLCQSFTPTFCLYGSVHAHNEMHFVSLTAFIWEAKFSLILQTVQCSLKVHNHSALTQLSVTSQIICLCWSICYLHSLHDLALLCSAIRMANSLK